jgi:phosphocarrier protein HPr
MITLELSIVNKLGLHARASSKLVSLASRYGSNITLHYNDKITDAKSILGVMMLGIAKGKTCTCQIEGEDESEAAQAITDLFASGFGENSNEHND